MVKQGNKRMRNRKDSGFSLLEVIIVLAIAGGIMVMYTQYARKKAESIAQQNVSDAIVAEMKGVLNFVDDDEIALYNEPDEIPNPLYEDNVDDPKPTSDYRVRITNELDDVDTGSEDYYYLWGDYNNSKNQKRYLFLSKKCDVTLKSDYEFEKEYLPCFMRNTAKNSMPSIERIGFAGTKETNSARANDINRIDVIVRFKKEQKNGDYFFADYYPHFSESLSKAGITISHAMLVHRNSTNAHWMVVKQKKDGKTPIEFGAIANNLDALNQYTTGEFGIRFTIDTNDNSSNSGAGGGKVCWTQGESGVKLCYDDNKGTGTHGEQGVLALEMSDPSKDNGVMPGTLKANVVMENTANRVFIFKRERGEIVFDDDGKPQPYLYNDLETMHDPDASWGDPFPGEITMNDSTSDFVYSDGRHYSSHTWDAFELTTPPTVSYSGPGIEGGEKQGINIDNRGMDEHGTPLPDLPAYQPYNDAADYSHPEAQQPYDRNVGGYRLPVQTCPQFEQDIILRDAKGQPLMDDAGAVRKYRYVRKLYPHMAAALSSISAFQETGPGQRSAANYDYASEARARLNSAAKNKLGQLGGISVQVEFALQNGQVYSRGYENNAGHYVHEKTKYVWVVSSTMGMFDGDTGEGRNVLNPSVSYVFTTWCSTIPQDGTPADVLDTQQYQ